MNLFYQTLLYRQGIGNIIQTLCHIHKFDNLYENIYLCFDNSFIPPNFPDPNPGGGYESRTLKLEILQRRIKQFIYWNEYFLADVKPLNIIYESHIINTNDRMHLLSNSKELFDISTLQRAEFHRFECEFTFEQDQIDMIRKYDIDIKFCKSKIQYNPNFNKVGLILRTSQYAVPHQRLDEYQCQEIINILDQKKLSYEFISFVKEEDIGNIIFADHTTYNSKNFKIYNNGEFSKDDLISHYDWLYNLSQYDFIICTEGGHAHIASCMNLPAYMVGNFKEKIYMDMNNPVFWKKFYKNSKIKVLDNYKQELLDIL